eukprot:gene7328-177_t
MGDIFNIMRVAREGRRDASLRGSHFGSAEAAPPHITADIPAMPQDSLTPSVTHFVLSPHPPPVTPAGHSSSAPASC